MHVHLTNRAAIDLTKIRRYSYKHWGKDTTQTYIADLYDGMTRAGLSPNLYLRPIAGTTPSFSQYLVRSHVLVFYKKGDILYLMTILHQSMDIINRVQHLLPTLAQELADKTTIH
jgi:plasmid stabilization system protein ParE